MHGKGIPRKSLVNIFLFILPVLLFFLFALFLRIIYLSDLPFVIAGDEGQVGLDARSFLYGNTTNIFTDGHWGIPSMYFYLVSISMKIFGNNIFGARMLSVIGGTLAIIPFYLLLKLLFRQQILVFIGTLLLATSAYHIHYSRLAVGQIYDPLFIVTELLLLLLYGKSKNILYLIIMGIILGFSQYFFFGTRVIPFIVFFWISIIVTKKHLLNIYQFLAVTMLVFLFAGIVFLPIGITYLTHSTGTYERLSAVGIPHFLNKYRIADLSIKDKAGFIFQQFTQPLLLFVRGGDNGYFYLETLKERPVMGFVIVPFIILGFIRLCWTLPQSKLPQIIFVWILFSLLCNGMIAELPPQSQRLIILLPAAIILTLGSFEMILDKLKKYPHIALGIIVCSTFLITIEETTFYFYHFITDQYEKEDRLELGTFVGKYLSTYVDEPFSLFFVLEDMYYYNANPALPFLAQRKGVDLKKIEDLENFPAGPKVVIVPESKVSLVSEYQNNHTVMRQIPINNRSGKHLAVLLLIDN